LKKGLYVVTYWKRWGQLEDLVLVGKGRQGGEETVLMRGLGILVTSSQIVEEEAIFAGSTFLGRSLSSIH